MKNNNNVFNSTIPSTRSTSNKQRISFVEGSKAWLIPYAAEHFIAMSITACQEIIEQPEWLTVPGSADYACGLMRWHHRWLALIDFDCLINSKVLPGQSDIVYALVVAYRALDGTTAYGALSLPSLPQMIVVQEEDFCSLPAYNPYWPILALSCFYYQGKAVPIIDPKKLFACSWHLRVESLTKCG